MQPDCLVRRRLLAALLASPLASPLAGQAAPKAAPLLLAQPAAPDVDPQGYLVSEKHDGVRAWWDGHSLRSRSGLPLAAPPWFQAGLPAVSLDGELWLGRGRFEAVAAAVRRRLPLDHEWRQIRYMVFELPGAAGTFTQRAQRIEALVRQQQRLTSLEAVEQAVLPSRHALQQLLQRVLGGGGEGLMLHRADAPYLTGRNPALLKLKPLHDAEALVLGHRAGRGRHRGRLGALHVRTAQGVEFLVGTGLTDALRTDPPAVGSWITYTHRGHTAAGVPRFASFLRPYPT